jgi:hypothetical protein
MHINVLTMSHYQLCVRIAAKHDRLETGTRRSHPHTGVHRDDPQLRKYVRRVLRSRWSCGYHDQGDTKNG